ncbi:MAG: ABC transporter ATP-binding protein, partial [Ralstonia sp.]
MLTPTLSVQHLRTHFFTDAGVAKAVDDVSFDIRPGEIVGLVGESGSGKSITGFSILGLIDAPGRIVGGRVLFKGIDLTQLTPEALRQLRGNRIAMIFQDPMMTLNPVLRIDTQMIEAVRAHAKVSHEAARERARHALAAVGIPSPDERLSVYPHQLSGGMRQRVAIAIAMLHEPELIIADEPTTALDVTVQREIVDLLDQVRRDRDTGILLVSHDFALIGEFADRAAVLYAGQIMEMARVDDLMTKPRHPYTSLLLECVPDLGRDHELATIPGSVPHHYDRIP